MRNEIVLVRHGETEWSRDRKHTSFTDLPLTENGRRAAQEVGVALRARTFSLVLSSPLTRARETATIALGGRGDVAVELDDDLREWNYGDYEGLTTAEIQERLDPDWYLWDDGCPGGESAKDVGKRVDRVIDRAMAAPGPVICFAHGHVLRALGARWLEMPAEAGGRFGLDTATISELGFEHGRRVFRRWNAPV